MDRATADLVDQTIEQLAPLAGTSPTSLREAAQAFDLYASSAPSALHERIAGVIAEECRSAADSVQVRRAFLQGLRS